MKIQGTVLIIEDDHNTRVSLRNCLEKAGCFVVSAANGASALELLGGMTPPSLILLDINMPIMGGDQFLSIIKSDPNYASIPIMQLTEADEPKREGTCCVIEKPLDLAKVLALIEGC